MFFLEKLSNLGYIGISLIIASCLSPLNEGKNPYKYFLTTKKLNNHEDICKKIIIFCFFIGLCLLLFDLIFSVN